MQRDDELDRLATAINELSQEISRSEKMQSEFISSISHELRTPLTAITGWSETLMFDTAIQGDSRRGIAIISKEAARLTSLVEELLEFTRIQDGRFNLSMELLDIESELEDTIFTYQELLRQDGMQLIYNPPEEESARARRPGAPQAGVSQHPRQRRQSTPATARRSKCPFSRTVKLLPFNLGTMAPASRKTSCRT
ncbi:MAG: histidine kinase dimerization/phospho-acceptor domain-containing protein [Oscillospiraceae bacterium]